MDCAYHPGIPAVYQCATCARPVCAACARSHGQSVICLTCAAALAAAAPPTAMPAVYSPPPAPARKPQTALWVGLGCGCLILATAVAIALGAWGYRHFRGQVTQQLEQVTPGSSSTPQPSTATTQSGTAEPEQAATGQGDDGSDEATAEARAVMERFIELDKVHDGEGMKELLAGQAAADFRADLQGQSDAETVEESITKVKPVNATTVEFQVKTVMKDMATGELANVYDTCVVTKTDEGWKITAIQYG